MSPLDRASRYLAQRCLAFERRLPPDDPADPQWDQYVQTVVALVAAHAQLTRALARVEPAPRSAITRAPVPRRLTPP
jgi:hypothetical protein